MASFSRTIKSGSLPPIEIVAMFYCYCLYPQLQKWNTLTGSTLNSKDWMKNG